MTGILSNPVEKYRRMVKNKKLIKAFEAKVKKLKARIKSVGKFNPKTNDLEISVSIAKPKKKVLKSR